MKTAFVLKSILGAAAVFSTASVAAAAVVPRMPAVMAESMVSEGNRYLNELEYEQAIAQFEMVLEIEPKNVEAIQGIIEAAYQAGDRDRAEEYLQYYWEAASEAEDFYEENKEELEKMTWGVRQLYEDPTDYIDFLAGLQNSMGKEDFRKQAEKAISDFIAEGAYDEAKELAQLVYDSTGEQEDSDILAKMYELCAEQAWREHEYDRALNLLEKAVGYDGDSERLQNELLRVAEDYIIVCFNSQQYDKADEIISRVQGLLGDDSLNGYVTKIAQMREVDAMLQRLIEELNIAFDADDITAIETLMNSQEFKDGVKEIRSVLYSSSLRQGEKPRGRGTAIYIIAGWPYVYYGDYQDGKRQGMGRWYYSTGEGYLTKYIVNWENDLPNGEGKIDKYGTLRIHDENGDVIEEHRTKNDVSFVCVNGVMDGAYVQHSDVMAEDSYSYDLTINLVNGYNIPLKGGEYPSEIDWYHKYKTMITAYAVVEHYDPWWGYYESHVWMDYSTNPYTVAGFENCITVVSPGTEDLILQ